MNGGRREHYSRFALKKNNNALPPLKRKGTLLFFCCPTRFRTWTLLNQNQTCCQLHHRTVSRLLPFGSTNIRGLFRKSQNFTAI
jgi:hypothetical protein